MSGMDRRLLNSYQSLFFFFFFFFFFYVARFPLDLTSYKNVRQGTLLARQVRRFVEKISSNI